MAEGRSAGRSEVRIKLMAHAASAGRLDQRSEMGWVECEGRSLIKLAQHLARRRTADWQAATVGTS
jgi:hypothetical protein